MKAKVFDGVTISKVQGELDEWLKGAENKTVKFRTPDPWQKLMEQNRAHSGFATPLPGS